MNETHSAAAASNVIDPHSASVCKLNEIFCATVSKEIEPHSVSVMKALEQHSPSVNKVIETHPATNINRLNAELNPICHLL
jgi:hypothetical protein